MSGVGVWLRAWGAWEVGARYEVYDYDDDYDYELMMGDISWRGASEAFGFCVHFLHFRVTWC